MSLYLGAVHRPRAAVATICLVLLAGCSSTKRATGGAADATVGGASAQAQPGLKPITSPIEIGFVQTAVSNAAQFDVRPLQRGR